MPVTPRDKYLIQRAVVILIAGQVMLQKAVY